MEEKIDKPVQLPDTRTNEERAGHEIAYGLQQSLACWSTDFIDPPVSKWLQNRYGNKEHEVTNKHVWGGEIMGDSAAFFVYLGIKRMFGKSVDAVTARVKTMFNGQLTKLGEKTLDDWAQEHHLDKDSPKYQRRLEAYKNFQAENMVDSTIIATSATLGNVGIQRALGNKQALAVVLGSKLVGASATLALMFGLRTTLPTATKALDDELSERYFSKVIRFVKKKLGFKPTLTHEELEAVSEKAERADGQYSAASVGAQKKALLDALAESYQDSDAPPAEKMSLLIQKEQANTTAFLRVLQSRSAFAKALTKEYETSLKRLYKENYPDRAEDLTLHETATIRIDGLITSYRDEILERKKSLDDPALAEMLKQHMASQSQAKSSKMPEVQQHFLAGALLKISPANARPTTGDVENNAKNLRIEYQALAESFSYKSGATQVLADELERHGATDTLAVAQSYMHGHHHEAEEVIEALAPNSRVMKQAMQQIHKRPDEYKSVSSQWSETLKASRVSSAPELAMPAR